MTSTPILKPGENCWRVERAEHIAFLVDGDAYFRAVRAAIERAERSVLILGWDIDSRIQLPRGPSSEPLPARLGPFLDAVVSRRPNLEAHVLVWDFAMIYALEREWLPIYKLDWQTHRRLHFHMDDRHPPGASQHQKVVVVDDAVAFVGGFDLSKWRWDTPDHRASEPRRTDAEGKQYPPFHDIQMAVSGDAAAALGDLARERWQRATGQRLDSRRRPARLVWPGHVTPDLWDTPVAIARTFPRYRDRIEVREVERLYLDAIAAAERYLYIENQYLTSDRICHAIAERLRRRRGPEVVMVLPCETGGWLEQYTMDVLRSRVLRDLRNADRHGRLRIYYPETPGTRINVHSKLLIVDEKLARIGSANLSNRSMGFDSECDLAIESQDIPARMAAINRLRDRLLGEHLGVAPDQVAAALEKHGALIAAIESLQGGERTLRELDGVVTPEVDSLVPDAALIDPERPVAPEQLVDRLVEEDEKEPASRHLLRNSLVLAAIAALAIAWRWTPLGEWLDMESLVATAGRIERSAWTPLLVLGGFVGAGLVGVPVTLLIIATLLTFDPVPGFLYALGGSALSAVASYGVGHVLGRSIVRRFAGGTINRLSRRLAQRGILTIVAVRIIPVAPFTVVNMVAGASHIGLRDFVIGTLLGMLPGTAALALFVDRLAAAARQPELDTITTLIAVAVILVLMAFGIRRWIVRRAGSPKEV